MKSFHWRYITNSKQLQLLLQILMDADRPMTQMDIQKEAERRGSWIPNPSTEVSEIGHNPGYSTSGGVKFSDGKYRYWLVRAPGWTPRWTVTDDFRVVPFTGQAGDYGVQKPARTMNDRATPIQSEPQAPKEKHTCKNCGAYIPAGAPWCNDTCRTAWKEKTFGVKA